MIGLVVLRRFGRCTMLPNTRKPGIGGADKLWACITSSADGNKLIATVFGGHIYTGEYF